MSGEAVRKKVTYIGAPASFVLDLAVAPLWMAFDTLGVYLVGSALQRPDWRDVDLRLMMKDDAFAALFPGPHASTHWEHDPRWMVMTSGISLHLSKMTGLPIDFQFQPMTLTNERHKGPRLAVGLTLAPPSGEAQ